MEAQLIVQKHGGSSVTTREKLKEVADKVAAPRQQGHQVVFVVSARGNTKDRLLA